MPVMPLVSFHVIRSNKKFYQYEAGDEAARVRPESDSASLAADTHNTADDLDQEPVPQHHPSRHADGRKDEPQRYNGVDFYPWK